MLCEENALDMVNECHLYRSLEQNCVLALNCCLKLNPKQKLFESKAMALLTNHTKEIPIQNIIQVLQTSADTRANYFLYGYLDALWVKNSTASLLFQNLQPELYAKHNPEKLLAFLKESVSYSVPDVILRFSHRRFYYAKKRT